MKVLIRDDKTRKYLARDGIWVAEAMEGMAFTSLRAAGQAREHEDCDELPRGTLLEHRLWRMILRNESWRKLSAWP
jgi:hypothetical protein